MYEYNARSLSIKNIGVKQHEIIGHENNCWKERVALHEWANRYISAKTLTQANEVCFKKRENAEKVLFCEIRKHAKTIVAVEKRKKCRKLLSYSLLNNENCVGFGKGAKCEKLYTFFLHV